MYAATPGFCSSRDATLRSRNPAVVWDDQYRHWGYAASAAPCRADTSPRRSTMSNRDRGTTFSVMSRGSYVMHVLAEAS